MRNADLLPPVATGVVSVSRRGAMTTAVRNLVAAMRIAGPKVAARWDRPHAAVVRGVVKVGDAHREGDGCLKF